MKKRADDRSKEVSEKLAWGKVGEGPWAAR